MGEKHFEFKRQETLHHVGFVKHQNYLKSLRNLLHKKTTLSFELHFVSGSFCYKEVWIEKSIQFRHDSALRFC